MDHATQNLIARARTGDDSAWASLIERENRRLIAVLAGILRAIPDRERLVEDLLQDVHLEAFRRLASLDDRGPGAFARWLAGIARNKALHALRQGRRRPTPDRLDATGALSPPSLRTTPASSAVKRELRSRVVRALDELPDDYRRVILLRHFEGLSSRAAAEVMERSDGAVRVLFLRALERLGTVLETLGGGDSRGGEGSR